MRSQPSPPGYFGLVHHSFNPDQAGPTTLRVSTFQAQLAWLQFGLTMPSGLFRPSYD